MESPAAEVFLVWYSFLGVVRRFSVWADETAGSWHAT